mgnify:FL=1
MQIVFNGQSLNVPCPCSISELLSVHELLKNIALDQVVMAVNQNFVHKHAYPDYQLKEGDNIEMLGAVVGG